MIIKYFKLILLSLFFLGNSLYGAGSGPKIDPVLIEKQKCEQLYIRFFGVDGDATRTVTKACLISANLLLFYKLNKEFSNNFDREKIIYRLIIYFTTAELMFGKFLEKYGCKRKQILFSGPLGVLGYALFNRFNLSSKLDGILANYNANDMPECVKNEFDVFIDYAANCSVTMQDKIKFIDKILKIIEKEFKKGEK